MKAGKIFSNIQKKKSFLCIGLDTDPQRIPPHLFDTDDPVFEFNKRIVDVTHDLAIAYKPNFAFYEAFGSDGIKSLEKTVEYIKSNYPDIFLIADAKRGDIGNTSGFYARAIFQNMDFDAVTLSPFMGKDSVVPYFSHAGKWVIILALTSNKGSSDFQFTIAKDDNKRLFEIILEKTKNWGNTNNTMFVVGATHPSLMGDVRKIVPDHFLLVPGVGMQGGDLELICRYGLNQMCGLIVNASRSIIYAGRSEGFKNEVRKQAATLQSQMAIILEKHNLL